MKVHRTTSCIDEIFQDISETMFIAILSWNQRSHGISWTKSDIKTVIFLML